MFKNAILRLPCQNIRNGLTSSDLGVPDFFKAYWQHSAYTEILRKAGLNITILDADEQYPDSVFIEDVAVCTPGCAVITRPGAESRSGEIKKIRTTLEKYFGSIEEIIKPGTLEAGDVMMVGSHFFIGISERTNDSGADQLISILKRYGMTGSKIYLKNILHLKSGISYLENNNMLVCNEFVEQPEFKKFNRIIVENDESYAANSLWINGKVLIAEGFPKTKEKIEKHGYETIVLDVSEFRKVDGGLSCLSLRF